MNSLNTDFLNSSWLIKMLEKSSKTPSRRLLNLYDILDDWLNAPNVAFGLSAQIGSELIDSDLKNQASEKRLQTYLSLQAAKAGAAMPEMLANQLYFMAVAAAQEKLQSENSQSPDKATSLSHAKVAAAALIFAQTKKEFRIVNPTNYALAASFFVVIAIVGSGIWLREPSAPISVAKTSPQSVMITTPVADPHQTAALMAQLEQMRHGNCQLIEAIQLPDSQKGIYINMIVNGQVSTDPDEQLIAIELLKKTRCNYTPMLMANSVG